MEFIETNLKDALIIEPKRLEDARGFFARTFCKIEFRDHGVDFDVVQSNISFNGKKGTLRGMHYQVEPYQESKTVRCTSGAIYDVIIDLRSESTTFKKWVAFELTAENRRMVYVPKGFGQGFQTLEDNTEVLYYMSEFYHPESARGVGWDDPTFCIEWPVPVTLISKKDSTYPLWEEER